MIIFSHRGLDLDVLSHSGESTLAAVVAAFKQGYGVEIDLQLSPTGELIIWHDMMIRRDFSRIEEQLGAFCRWSEIIKLARQFPKVSIAVHIKSYNQNDAFFFHFYRELRAISDIHDRVLVFDLLVPWAERLRLSFPKLGLAPSLAHVSDIQRFNEVTGGTLLTLDAVLRCRHAYNWVWLDEWDLLDEYGRPKVLYSPENCSALKAAGYRIALISPELHKNEGHPDGLNISSLEIRWNKLFELPLDAVCTDYPSRWERRYFNFSQCV